DEGAGPRGDHREADRAEDQARVDRMPDEPIPAGFDELTIVTRTWHRRERPSPPELGDAGAEQGRAHDADRIPDELPGSGHRDVFGRVRRAVDDRRTEE